MIPQIVPPLTGLGVLVTRPALQAQGLIEAITRLGGEALAFPTIEIVAAAAAHVQAGYDLIVYTSVNAVHHSATLVDPEASTRIAAIGPATAAALSARNLTAHTVPDSANSETLLEAPTLNLAAGQRALLVRGVGGRELLHEALHARGLSVDVLEVYQRVLPTYTPAQIATLEANWNDGGVDVVTVTSGDALKHLHALLSTDGRQLLHKTPVVVPSMRVRDLARAEGLATEFLLAPGADTAAMIGTLAAWHTRSKTYADA